MKTLRLLFAFVCFSSSVQSQSHIDDHFHIYNWDWQKDGYILTGSLFAWGGSQLLKASADKITLSDLPTRDPMNLWGIDRGATENYSLDAQKWSDVFLYSSFLLPFTHYTGLKCRKQGFIVAGMAFETFLINDAITNTLKALTKRFRPFTYNSEVSNEIKLSNGARYSFASGHASNTAALGFFSAKVFSDLYPHSKWKPVIWTLGVTLPAMTGYLRYRAGKHFPTDIIAGYALGATIGYLVPHFHKVSNDDLSLNLIPVQNGMMLSFTKTLK
ncbi:MAG: phosphatase PAP2 family protein [Saprospiraceae bacterium]|nr:phosphatase PAP2 family protein [Bacteroidia bacterium]NNL93867.1 phosphatase PAP2 family protein [Saprospiraceae bacterium]